MNKLLFPVAKDYNWGKYFEKHLNIIGNLQSQAHSQGMDTCPENTRENPGLSLSADLHVQRQQEVKVKEGNVAKDLTKL